MCEHYHHNINTASAGLGFYEWNASVPKHTPPKTSYIPKSLPHSEGEAYLDEAIARHFGHKYNNTRVSFAFAHAGNTTPPPAPPPTGTSTHSGGSSYFCLNPATSGIMARCNSEESDEEEIDFRPVAIEIQVTCTVREEIEYFVEPPLTPREEMFSAYEPFSTPAGLTPPNAPYLAPFPFPHEEPPVQLMHGYCNTPRHIMDAGLGYTAHLPHVPAGDVDTVVFKAFLDNVLKPTGREMDGEDLEDLRASMESLHQY
ncbi:hypothetical protein BXZ70DRAFT_283956 [Cristinia sonorae]|uniref:Uncharacterized protein n=1 Tax=Cristinia sonorae TaxID=1940300 RepID=A0A8K0XUR8_9AGAR|nr:hypothetical protein BXZ70DRAFT_283956 [Cristinia sonorae]